MGDHKLNIAYYLSQLLNRPYTTTIHAHELYRISEERFSNLKNLYNNCHIIFTISEYNKNLLMKKFQIDDNRIKIMYLYPTNFSNSLQRNKKILIVGNWFYKKGYDFLLKAIKKLNRNDFILWVVGNYTKEETSIDVNRLVDVIWT